jgi:hypothetical protein
MRRDDGVDMAFIRDTHDWLMIGLGTVAAILIYDYFLAPRLRRRVQRQVKDSIRASFGAGAAGRTDGEDAGAGPAAPSGAPAEAVPAAPARGADPSGSGTYRVEEYAKSLRDQQAKLDEERKGLVEERARLEVSRRELESDREQVDALARDVAEARVALEARRAAMESSALVAGPAGGAGAPHEAATPAVQWTALEARARELEAEKEQLARERGDVESRRLALDQRERALAQHKEDVERERAALLDVRKQLAARQESIEQMQKRHAQLLVALERERTEAAKLPEPVRAALDRLRQEGEAALQAPPPPLPEAPAPAAENPAHVLLRAFYAAVPAGTSPARADAFLVRIAEDEGLATPAQIRECRELQQHMDAPASFGFLLLRMGALDEAKLRRVLEVEERRLGRAASGDASEPPAATPSPPADSPVDRVAGAATAPYLEPKAPPDPASGGSTGRAAS